ncbi:hypothetical protein GCM10010121_099350 [Streptomyces brasiliensis]|uniref:Uncharacterized protein n=1 Tax=Streptomyces brasiliensis TaxID=1954 RepID=A0A917PEL6_9ACTN|nr:hypothetical protein GCM10010121_099350 [Streptomyces brasiliensis]
MGAWVGPSYLLRDGEGGPQVSEYNGHQYVGVDLHRRRSVSVRQTEDGVQLSAVRIQ